MNCHTTDYCVTMKTMTHKYNTERYHHAFLLRDKVRYREKNILFFPMYKYNECIGRALFRTYTKMWLSLDIDAFSFSPFAYLYFDFPVISKTCISIVKNNILNFDIERNCWWNWNYSIWKRAYDKHIVKKAKYRTIYTIVKHVQKNK